MESGGASPMPRTATPLKNGKRKICVYCGSSPGTKPEHMEAARQLARVMAANDIGLVYGGGTVGLMGEIARTLVSLAGPAAVHGIIPEPLVKYERDPTYTSSGTSSAAPSANGTTTELAIPEEAVFGKTTIVPDMHTRKKMMAQEVQAGAPGSGFIALPGGFGTMEELLEICTWNQLGIQRSGICVLNVNGFYDGLMNWIQKSIDEGFIRPGNMEILASAATPEEAVKLLAAYKTPDSVLKLKWGNE
ncbi:hypothetical protein BD289DRAFT_465048 [Coniella lustricola]|uniref:Lysine decarboxylase-like protein n=1 Tax=Coniella lustricola TaxID=2025994 RepID=A0A2T3AJU5_9PEZI|nr:hypothetical protein BD289DRAFT_465048 [Coniella lustricola]